MQWPYFRREGFRRAATPAGRDRFSRAPAVTEAAISVPVDNFLRYFCAVRIDDVRSCDRAATRMNAHFPADRLFRCTPKETATTGVMSNYADRFYLFVRINRITYDAQHRRQHPLDHMTPDEFLAALAALQWKQSDFCRACGLAPDTPSRWAKGHTPIPKWVPQHLALLRELAELHRRYLVLPAQRQRPADAGANDE